MVTIIAPIPSNKCRLGRRRGQPARARPRGPRRDPGAGRARGGGCCRARSGGARRDPRAGAGTPCPDDNIRPFPPRRPGFHRPRGRAVAPRSRGVLPGSDKMPAKPKCRRPTGLARANPRHGAPRQAAALRHGHRTHPGRGRTNGGGLVPRGAPSQHCPQEQPGSSWPRRGCDLRSPRSSVGGRGEAALSLSPPASPAHQPAGGSLTPRLLCSWVGPGPGPRSQSWFRSAQLLLVLVRASVFQPLSPQLLLVLVSPVWPSPAGQAGSAPHD